MIAIARPINILMVTPRFFPYSGGVENHVYQVAKRLASSGNCVTVLTTDLSRELAPYEEVEGIKVQRVPAWPAKRDYYFAPDIYKIIKQGKWDIVHCQSYHTLVAPLAMFAARQAKIPYVVTFHGGGHSSRLRNFFRSVQWAALSPLISRAERLIATANFEIDYYVKRMKVSRHRFRLIPNGADLPPLPKTASVKESTLIASVGRLEKYKGHDRVIAAFPKLLEYKPNARLWIAGTGPYEEALRLKAAQLGIADKVTIKAVPIANRQEWAEELSKASLVTLLSDHETHPMAMLEAAALGIPLLVSNTTGLGELAEKGLGKAIAPDSPPAQIAAALLEQLDNPQYPNLGALSTWDDCARDLQSLYLEILEQPLCVV